MSDAQAWVHWWACAWRHAHAQWPTPDPSPALIRSQAANIGRGLGVEPCLPCPPTPHLIQLALAHPLRHDAMLQRLEHICRSLPATGPDATQPLWCQRLARALGAQGWLAPADDALQLLRAWVEPPVWQRLRLRFAPDRVTALEQQPLPAIPPNRLRTLWQTVLWHEVHDHAVTPHP